MYLELNTCTSLTTAEYICLLIKMLGSVFLSVNDMITKIRYEYNLAVVDKERQGIRRQENSVYKRRDTEELCPHQPIVQ